MADSPCMVLKKQIFRNLSLAAICLSIVYISGAQKALTAIQEGVAESATAQAAPEPVGKNPTNGGWFEVRAKKKFITFTGLNGREMIGEILDVSEKSLEVRRKKMGDVITLPIALLVENDRDFANYLFEKKKQKDDSLAKSFEVRAKEKFITFTDTKGREIVAEVLDISEDSLKIRKIKDTRETKLPIVLLAENDRLFAKYLFEKKQHKEGQVKVNSLAKLLPFLDDDNVDVKLEPGVYTITEDDARNGRFQSYTFIRDSKLKALLLFKGNNSTYDFTGVTIKVETGVFQSGLGDFKVYQVHVTGNKNVIKNLTLEDVGSVNDFPRRGCVNVVMDGSYNRIEGFHITSKGSKPYGYGDAFGKGGKRTIIGHKKHSTFLIRGLYNHAKNCTFIHRTYGHCIFMQAASHPTIEGCHIEGEMRTTDDMLKEKGTGSPADRVDFMTTWGYELPAGYMMSTGEAGIRAYNAGQTIINGEIIERGTDNPTVLDCTVKYMRTCVTLTHATGKKYVKGCTSIGCEQAFAIGTGSIIDCYADAAYGPVYRSTYDSDKGVHVEITILPSDTYYNGSKCVAYLGGKNHNITLRAKDPNTTNQDLSILVGGYFNGLRVRENSNPTQNNHSATNSEINNYTDYPMILPSNSSGISGRTHGSLIDNGTKNKMKRKATSRSHK